MSIPTSTFPAAPTVGSGVTPTPSAVPAASPVTPGSHQPHQAGGGGSGSFREDSSKHPQTPEVLSGATLTSPKQAPPTVTASAAAGVTPSSHRTTSSSPRKTPMRSPFAQSDKSSHPHPPHSHSQPPFPSPLRQEAPVEEHHSMNDSNNSSTNKEQLSAVTAAIAVTDRPVPAVSVEPTSIPEDLGGAPTEKSSKSEDGSLISQASSKTSSAKQVWSITIFFAFLRANRRWTLTDTFRKLETLMNIFLILRSNWQEANYTKILFSKGYHF